MSCTDSLRSVSKRPRRPASKPRRRSDRHRRADPKIGRDEPDLIADVTAALAAEHPLQLLALLSGLLNILDPRSDDPFRPERDPALLPRDELLLTFFDVDMVGTSALLAGIAGLSDDDVLQRRVQHAVADRGHVLPRWLTELPRATPAARTVEVVHVLGDGDNVLVGVRLSGGAELTAVVYIDHNLGTVVKDAFVVPQPIDELLEAMLVVAGDPDTVARDIAPADARARITDAITSGAQTYPPYESDSWPACRPLVEWMVAMLPTGGSGYERVEWSDGDLAELSTRFLASAHGSEFDDPDHRSLLESLLWFGSDYGPGDPLHWSPPAVEILLLDWIPRKIVAEATLLAKAPDVLRAFIRFCHEERGVRAAHTTETLAVVDEYEREYQRIIRAPRPQGPAALLTALRTTGPDELLSGAPAAGDEWLDEIVLDELRRVVGGGQALARLHADPLPDEDVAWASMPADIHERVNDVAGLIDRFCAERTDAEFRTACRRLLTRAAAADPAIFRRRSRADTAAAAVCWIVGKANMLFDPRAATHMTVKDMAAWFGLAGGSFSQRSEPFLRAIGVEPGDRYGAMDLGSPDYLTAARRAAIIADRDRHEPTPG